jgi:hypothetical protein
MGTLCLNDVGWKTTFPHLVAPLQNEWLPGLLLRCDAANHWESGTTLAHLFRSIKSSLLKGRKGKPGWIVVPSPALEYLAQVLAVPVSMLLATTYQAELTRLYAPSGPHEAQLSRIHPLRLCPACVAESRLLRREFVLPHIQFCPCHEVELVSICQCGAVLQLFSPYEQPFLCHDCGWEWARLPLFPAPPGRFQLEQKVLFCYEVFLTRGTPQLLAHALQFIRENLKREKIIQVRLLDGKIKSVEHYELTKASLGYLVDLIVSLDLSIQDF